MFPSRDPRRLTGGSVPPAVDHSTPELAPISSRRSFLIGGALAAATGVAAGVGIDLTVPMRALAQSPLTPDAALARLLDGNKRFVNKRLTSFDEDLVMLRQQTAEKQEPFAGILTCADSRVPTELIFDQSIGHIFVTRVAGNIASAEIIASLEYGVAALGTVLIVVMGHSACGAVKAAAAGKAAPGQISTLYRYIRPAVDKAGGDLDGASKANAQIQAKLLRDSSPVIAEHIAQGSLRVVAGYYQLSSGTVSVLESA
jgi:carbonic anhydrase